MENPDSKRLINNTYLFYDMNRAQRPLRIIMR